MLRFHVNKTPDLDFIEVKKKVKSCQAAQINESFEVGTGNGIAKGKEGDYLLMDGSCLSVVRGQDFENVYEVVKKKVVKKTTEKEKPKAVKKPVVKKPVEKKAKKKVKK